MLPLAPCAHACYGERRTSICALSHCAAAADRAQGPGRQEKAPATSGCVYATTTNCGDGSRRCVAAMAKKLKLQLSQCAQKTPSAVR